MAASRSPAIKGLGVFRHRSLCHPPREVRLIKVTHGHARSRGLANFLGRGDKLRIVTSRKCRSDV